MSVSILLLALMLRAAEPASEATWYEHYEHGVSLIERGKSSEAVTELKAALSQRPQEGLQVSVREGRYLDYLPHLYLAIASQMNGDVEDARKHLAAAEKSGVAGRSAIGKPLLLAYQLLLRKEESLTRPTFSVVGERAGTLSDEEFDQLIRDILAESMMQPTAKLSDAPWYVHYELALALERRGDHARALRAFLDAAAKKPDSQRKVRTYGMWLVDYVPYFHIAKMHAALENWRAAADALEISQRLKEITPDSYDHYDYEQLQWRLRRKLKEF